MLKLGAIFKDQMVLQQMSEAAVFGETDCEKVEVVFDGEGVLAKIEQGRFLAVIHTKQVLSLHLLWWRMKKATVL